MLRFTNYKSTNYELCNCVGAGGEAALFGWSLTHHGGSLYVGAPLAGQSGKVFRCDHLTSSPSRTCLTTTSPADQLTPTSWFGATMAASTNDLYSCAFRYKWKKYDSSWKLGKCFSLTGGNNWRSFFDFTNYFQKSSSSWYRRGIYGFSSTVNDAGDLGNSSFLRFKDKDFLETTT